MKDAAEQAIKLAEKLHAEEEKKRVLNKVWRISHV